MLFDLDGTLHDSDPVWRDALLALADRHEVVAAAGAFEGLAGLSTPEAVALVHGRLGLVGGDVPADVRWLETRVSRVLLERAGWYPGALDLVRAVRAQGVPTALVTSSSRILVDSLLTGPAADLFDTVVTENDVVNVKPDPEPYLLAAARLGLNIADCVAVEDSPAGLASATAAGCQVLDIGRVADRSALDPAFLGLG